MKSGVVGGGSSTLKGLNLKVLITNVFNPFRVETLYVKIPGFHPGLFLLNHYRGSV